MANINAQFNYSANFGPVIGQMQKLTAEANLLNNTLQNLDKQAVGLKTSLAASFASDLGKIGGYNAKMIELTDSVDQFGQSLLKQKLTLKQYAQEAIGAFTKSSNAHKLAVREVAREMSQLVTLGKGMDGKQMGMMITPATINLKDFNTQMAVSQKQWSIFNSLVQDGTTHLINFGKNTQWAGRQITVGLTVPLTIYGNTVSKIFREVDAELTRFQKVYGSDLMNSTSNATEQMVDDVRNLAIEFSKSFGIAAKETASLAADLAATGLEGQKLLASLRETTRLAVLGDVSNQDAMKTTLSLQNAFKISTDELANSVNFLNAVENQTSLSLQDLTTAIPKAGPVVKSLGGDVKDLSLLMVALKEGGISAAEGANALKSGMASLINPTKQASITAKQYGIDINAIVQANRGQLMPTIIAFQQQLQLLDDFGKAQVIENVFGKYQFARISALFDNLNASASQTNAVLGLMGKSNKELAATAYQEMDTLMNSSSKRFQRAIEGIKAQFISIGGSITSAITPILENVTSKIAKAIEFFQNLPKPVKSFIKVATGLTAIAGPIIMMVGIFSNFLGYIGKGAMGMVNLGRRMAGIPTQKFEMLTDTQIMATKATEQLAKSFDVERSSVERLNQALGIYRQNLVEAINLNPAFVNRQMPLAAPTTPQLRMGGRMPGYANNSSAWVPGSGDGDKVPAMLEPGEYVVNKKAAAKYSDTLDQMNFQSAPRFQKGGRMPGYAETSMLPYESVSGQGKKAQPFIGPLPQISYGIQGSYMPGGYTPFVEYPFSSRESAEAFQATDPRKYGGRASRITRDINDPQQQAYADWIAGHNSNQFRTGTGVMKRMDMEGHRDQMLRSMGPISQSIPLYRGTVLREKGANEFSGVGARELLMYIKHGMFEKAMGKKIQWSDMQSFSSIPNIANYSKFIESWTNPSNTNSKKAVDRQLASMEMLPVIFRLASAKGQNGFNLSERALVQEVGMGDVIDEKEWVLNRPSGTITGIRQDMGTKNYIVDLMQNGGRVQSAQGGLTEEQKQQAFFDYTDMSAQNRQFEGFGRGAFRTVRNYDALYRTNPLQNAFHVLLPNAVGRSEEEKTQLNILRRYMSMFNITDPNQLDAGMQASLMEMFMVHGGNARIGIDPSLIKTMGEYDTGSAQLEGPGTYFSSSLKMQDEAWDDYAGIHKYTISKTREAFRKVARGKGYVEAYDEDTDFHEPSKQLKALVNSFSRTKSGKEATETKRFVKNNWLRDVQYAAEHSGAESPFIKYLIEKEYQGINWGPGIITNFNIGRKGISLSSISNPLVNSLYDNDIEEYVDLKKPYQATIPNLSPVGYQSGGRINGYADESLMPEKYSKKMEGIQSVMDATSQEATGGMYAGMPMTDIGNLVDRIGGRSAAIPGASGIYEQGGVRSVVKGHNTATSARIEAIASALTRSIFGLESPVQEFIKFGHPETSSPMFGVRSPFDEKFAKTTGKISPDKFFMQALSAIIRGDSDLQPDNLYDGIVVDQGAGYGSDRASQPRGLTGKKFSVGDQARVNFLMQKGGARRWFTEATAGIASGMTREQYIGGFMQAISQAQANFPAAMASLAGMNLTKEEQQIFGVLAGDLEAARGIDWGSIYDSHIGVTPEVKKPPTEAAAAKALLTKQANKEDYEKAIAAGYPSWMGYAQGGRINGYATKSMSQGPEKDLYEKEYQSNKLAFAHSVPYMNFGASRLLYPIGFDIPRTMNANLSKSSVREIELDDHINRPKALTTMTSLFNKIGTNVNPKTIQSFVSNRLNKTNAQDTINDPELYTKTLQSKTVQSLMEDFKKQGEFSDVRTNLKDFGVDKAFAALGYMLEEDGSYTLTSAPAKLEGFPLPEKIYQRNKDDYTVFQTSPSGVGGTLAKTRDNTERRRANSPGTKVYPNVIEVALAKLFGATDELTGKKVTGISHLLDPQNLQSGGRLKGYATETTTWAKKAAAPKAYAGVLQGIPNWATKPAEYQAIVSALQAAGIPESDRLASFYIQDVLAHINPSTTNENGIYEKVWSAANLMKDSQVYNVFLETLRTRKDIGGLLNPSTVSRVAAASGLPMPVVQAELTKIADGVHPNTANGARVMMTLARMFPSRTSPGMPIAVAAGMGARLQGNFYDTLGQRALPSSLPNTTVRAYDPKGTGAPTSTGQGSRVRSTGLIMPSGAIRPSMVMPNIQSIPSAAGGTGTNATVKVDGMGNVLSNGIDDMVAKTITGQPIAVSSKELLAIGPGGGIAGVTSPGDEARGKIVHPMGTALMRGGKFQRLRGFADESMTEPIYQDQASYGRMDRFAASMSFLTSGVYTLQTAFQQFTATTADGADKFTKMAAATTLVMTSMQGVSQMLVSEGKLREMNIKSMKMQGMLKPKLDKSGKPILDQDGNQVFGKANVKAPVSGMSSGMGKLLGVGSKALGFLGGPVGMIATSVAISAINKGIAMYQAAVGKAKAAGQAMFKDPIEGAKLLGITLKDTSAIAQTYGKIAQGLGMKGTGKGAYDKTYAEVVKKDYGDLIGSLKLVLNEEEKRNKLALTYINLKQKGFSNEDAKEYTKEIARQSGAMSAFNGINLDALKTSKDIANQTVASTKALMDSIGKVDKSLIGKYINTETGSIYSKAEEAYAADKSIGNRRTQMITESTPKNLGAGLLGAVSSLGLNEKQLGEAIAGALKTAYSIAATDPAAANYAGAMIIENIAKGTQEQQDSANAAILEMMKEAGASSADAGFNFVSGGGLTKMAKDAENKFAGMGPKFANAISVAIQSGNTDIVNKLFEESKGDLSPEAMNAFVNKLARVQALAKIDLEVDIQLEQTKKQLELIKTELGKTFDILIASKQAEVEIENKRHEQAMKNLDNEAKRLNDKKDILQRNTDYYIKELEREKQAEDYYSNQRKTGLSGLKAISGGDVFGFIGAQMDAASSADQFGRDRSLQAIQETADAGQKKLDEELRAIDNRKEAEAGRHEAELANIEAEIEFLNKKRAISVGAAEKAISKIEKVVAMSPSDPGYQSAVQEAMSLATTAGMQASQVLQNADTSSMTKEELTDFNKVKKDLGLAIETFNTDKETALGVLGQDVEAITKNIAESLGAAGDILSQVVADLNQPVKPNSAIAKVAELAGIDIGTSAGEITGESQITDGSSSGSSGSSGSSTKIDYSKTPPAKKPTKAGLYYSLADPLKNVWQYTNNGWVKSFAPSSYAIGLASGGAIEGPGTGTSDSIPIMASNGEYIFKADVVKRIGKARLDQINNGNFAYGGMVGSMPGMSSAPGMANGGFVGSMPSASSAPGMVAGGFIGNSAPSTPKYNIPSAGGGMSPAPIARMARGGQISSSSSNVNSSPVMNFNGAGMDMVMHHVNKAVGGRISSNSRRIG